MARKATTSRAVPKKKKPAKRRAAPAKGAARAIASARTTKRVATGRAKAQAVAAKTAGPAKKGAKRTAARAGPKAAAAPPVVNKTTMTAPVAADAKTASALESVQQQINQTLLSLKDLVAAQSVQGGANEGAITADRAAATFQRLVNEVVEDQLSQMLPPLVTLRNEMTQHAAAPSTNGSGGVDFHRRGTETLDHVLTLAGAEAYEARPGEMCDPLIHLAVAETQRDDIPNGAVSEPLQPGFRTARGKVIGPARVRVNRI